MNLEKKPDVTHKNFFAGFSIDTGFVTKKI